ncbi:MAG: Thioredoxin-dependent 5'-adenylylsulfate reductase [Bacteroidia bacterium]|nr:Thioredoxin-dependent 5'-adenylylsulfate reductase [Bacteroidia bacterium]
MSLVTAQNLSEQFKGKPIPEVITALAQDYKQIVFSTSFGQEDQVLTDIIFKNNLAVEVFTLDTGRLFNETYETFDRTIKRYKKEIKTYFPDKIKTEELLTKKGPFSFYESVDNRKECCHIRKVEPLQRALKGKDIWITGLRSAQSAGRENLPLFQWDETYQLIKHNPLANWSLEKVVDYLNVNNVPYNPLHDKGFVSIGCAPCTRAIEPGEDIRAGRWWWEDSKKECGLHETK